LILTALKIPATDKQYYSLSYASFGSATGKSRAGATANHTAAAKRFKRSEQDIETLKKQNQLLLKRLEALENKK